MEIVYGEEVGNEVFLKEVEDGARDAAVMEESEAAKRVEGLVQAVECAVVSNSPKLRWERIGGRRYVWEKKKLCSCASMVVVLEKHNDAKFKIN
ncbi:hypothetical protein CJ030_MR2G028946 [Morella rubra]|uniref:Uncharacterized protein n=1 Tax=Morella rubra TaxID=262757 RepID=A0A6A1WDU3_9ROSI|nr:hypothetical protein CJ030_MR2G028946 [Morella rubra]